MFGVEGTLIFFLPFNIVLIFIYLSHPYSPLLFIFHIFLLFPPLPFFAFSVHIYMVVLCKKIKNKKYKKGKFKIAYARRNKKKQQKTMYIKRMSTREMISSITTNVYNFACARLK